MKERVEIPESYKMGFEETTITFVTTINSILNYIKNMPNGGKELLRYLLNKTWETSTNVIVKDYRNKVKMLTTKEIYDDVEQYKDITSKEKFKDIDYFIRDTIKNLKSKKQDKLKKIIIKYIEYGNIKKVVNDIYKEIIKQYNINIINIIGLSEYKMLCYTYNILVMRKMGVNSENMFNINRILYNKQLKYIKNGYMLLNEKKAKMKYLLLKVKKILSLIKDKEYTTIVSNIFNNKYSLLKHEEIFHRPYKIPGFTIEHIWNKLKKARAETDRIIGIIERSDVNISTGDDITNIKKMIRMFGILFRLISRAFLEQHNIRLIEFMNIYKEIDKFIEVTKKKRGDIIFYIIQAKVLIALTNVTEETKKRLSNDIEELKESTLLIATKQSDKKHLREEIVELYKKGERVIPRLFEYLV